MVKMRRNRQEYFKQYYQKNRERKLQYQNEYRQEHLQENQIAVNHYRERNPEKVKAQIFARQHIPRKNTCEFCGATSDLQRHHPDYNHPEIVVTVCRLCHNWIHRGD